MTGKRYMVEDVGSGDQFGNHTQAEAVARAQIMRRNWNYKKVFVVKETTTEGMTNGRNDKS